MCVFLRYKFEAVQHAQPTDNQAKRSEVYRHIAGTLSFEVNAASLGDQHQGANNNTKSETK
jgi:hypothetical protein